MKIHERKMKFGWDGDEGIGEKLIRQVLEGVKTATCDMKCFCTEQEIADLSAEAGWMETVVDREGNPRCNVRVTGVYETTFGNPDPRLVRGEGDGDDVLKFKRDHEKCFSVWLREAGLPPLADDSVLVVWEFELVESVD
ncbi:MAG: ASCH domain-containing protein [Pyrinomonadaceae bacterium]